MFTRSLECLSRLAVSKIVVFTSIKSAEPCSTLLKAGTAQQENGPTIVSQPREVKYSFGWFRISHSFSNRNLNSQFSSFQRCYLQAASGNVNATMLPPSRQQFQAPMCCAPCTATGGSGTRLRATHPRLTLKRVGLPDLRFLAFEMQTLSVPLSFGCYSPAVEGAISEPWQ